MPKARQPRSKSTSKATTPTVSDNENTNKAEEITETDQENEARPVSIPTKDIRQGKWDELAQSLRACGWEQLQERFIEAMDDRSDKENALQKETADLLEVFIAWSQTTVFCDEDRAYKRFKTRMDYVQNSEERLEDKKQHYANVVKAFENALALLRNE